MSSKFWIFGDSFSAKWKTENRLEAFPAQNEYIEREKQDGIDYIGDLEYWLNKSLNKADLSFTYNNYARGGMSTDTILGEVDKYYNKMQKGDVVLLQLSIQSRVRTVTGHLSNPIDVNFPNHPQDQDMELYKELMEPFLFFDFDYLEKKAVEQTTEIFKDALEQKVLFYKKAFENTGITAVITSLDYKMCLRFDLPMMYYDSECKKINQKYSEIKDNHPTYESNKMMSEKISKLVINRYKT
jgi:hypothetical protein|tara:strand:+ start:2547 stop:3269 length:723 start_codon:yes stop_codon:yes gene_type:complete